MCYGPGFESRLEPIAFDTHFGRLLAQDLKYTLQSPLLLRTVFNTLLEELEHE